MKFLIDFNRNGEDSVLAQLDTEKEFTDNGELIGYFLTLNSLEDIGTLEKKIEEVTGENYSLIISVSELYGNIIYIDKDI